VIADDFISCIVPFIPDTG